jgi:histone-lysine N-methyltransferase SETMAR
MQPLHQKNICDVYGEGAVSDRTCRKWFSRMREGDVDLNDEPPTGLTSKVDDDQIRALTETDRHLTVPDTAAALNVSKNKWRIFLKQV